MLSDLIEELDKEYKNKRIDLDILFATIVKLVSYRSSCAKTKQAALITKNSRIVSLGWNGPPSGDINCIEMTNGEGVCGKDTSGSCRLAIHCEQNAISYSARNGINPEGSTMYITMTPCISCARLIIASGIKKVKYLEEYRLTEGLDFLKKCNIETTKLKV